MAETDHNRYQFECHPLDGPAVQPGQPPGDGDWISSDYPQSPETGYGRISYAMSASMHYRRFSVIPIKPGLSLTLMAFHPGQMEQMAFYSRSAPIEFSFCLSPSNGIHTIDTGNSGKYRAISRPDMVVISYLPHTEGRIHLAKCPLIIGAGLHIDPGLLSTYLAEDLDRLPPAILGMLSGEPSLRHMLSITVPPRARAIVEQMFHHPPLGAVAKLFFESSALELLSLYIEAILRDNHEQAALSQKDIGLMHTARSILFREFENPPSLVQLARRLGTNECKLKWGFREVFGTSVYQCLKNHRMDLARVMIEHDTNVSKTALAVGYVNVSHFITAFKKRHGITPGELRQNHRSGGNYSGKGEPHPCPVQSPRIQTTSILYPEILKIPFWDMKDSSLE